MLPLAPDLYSRQSPLPPLAAAGARRRQMLPSRDTWDGRAIHRKCPRWLRPTSPAVAAPMPLPARPGYGRRSRARCRAPSLLPTALPPHVPLPPSETPLHLPAPPEYLLLPALPHIVQAELGQWQEPPPLGFWRPPHPTPGPLSPERQTQKSAASVRLRSLPPQRHGHRRPPPQRTRHAPPLAPAHRGTRTVPACD